VQGGISPPVGETVLARQAKLKRPRLFALEPLKHRRTEALLSATDWHCAGRLPRFEEKNEA
jgi:hypothetical protein